MVYCLFSAHSIFFNLAYLSCSWLHRAYHAWTAFSIVWVLLCLLLSFSGLLAYFLWEEQVQKQQSHDVPGKVEQGKLEQGTLGQGKLLPKDRTTNEYYSERVKS